MHNTHSSFSAYRSSAASLLSPLSLPFPHAADNSRTPVQMYNWRRWPQGSKKIFPMLVQGVVWSVMYELANALSSTYWSLIAVFLLNRHCTWLADHGWDALVKHALHTPQTSARKSKDLSAHANNRSTATLSSADLHSHICSALPSPLLTLASPHPSSQLKCCQSMLAKISFSPSPSLVLLYLCLHQLSSERQLRQTGILDKLVWGGVFTELLYVIVSSTGNCWALTLLS